MFFYNAKKFISTTTKLLICITFLSFCSCINENSKKFRHVVAFKFKQEVSQTQIDDIISDFSELQNEIPSIINFEGGKDVSNENQHKGFTHIFTVTFKDEGGRAIYQPHPVHQAFVKKVTPLLEKVFVMDYETK